MLREKRKISRATSTEVALEENESIVHRGCRICLTPLSTYQGPRKWAGRERGKGARDPLIFFWVRFSQGRLTGEPPAPIITALTASSRDGSTQQTNVGLRTGRHVGSREVCEICEVCSWSAGRAGVKCQVLFLSRILVADHSSFRVTGGPTSGKQLKFFCHFSGVCNSGSRGLFVLT